MLKKSINDTKLSENIFKVLGFHNKKESEKMSLYHKCISFF